MGATLRIDTREFDRALREYRRYSSRDPATICNVKSYRILKSATYKTPKASRDGIRQDLMQPGRNGAPIAALIVNKARKLAGLPGLTGTLMKAAVAKLIKSRRIATLRAGNVQAMKDLAPFVHREVSGALERITFGQSKGYARPASEGGFKAKTEFGNKAGAKWDKRDTATPKALPAWQAAFNEETASMKEYVEKKLKDSATKAGIKHH